MREAKLLFHLDPIALAPSDAARRPLTDAIQCQDGGFLEGGREKGAGAMRFVVLGKDESTRVLAAESLGELAGGVELLFEPERKPHEEEAKTARGVGEIGLEEPIKFQQWFVVEGDEIEIAVAEARLAEGKRKSPPRGSGNRVFFG